MKAPDLNSKRAGPNFETRQIGSRTPRLRCHQKLHWSLRPGSTILRFFSYPTNDHHVNTVLPLKVSTFGAPALLASFCRHAPPLGFRKANTTAGKSWLGPKEGKENCFTYAEHPPIITGMQVSLPPVQEAEIKVDASMFPGQRNLDHASSGHTAKRTEEVRTFTECQPHGKTEPGQWRLCPGGGGGGTLKSSGKRGNPNNWSHTTKGGEGERGGQSPTTYKKKKAE